MRSEGHGKNRASSTRRTLISCKAALRRGVVCARRGMGKTGRARPGACSFLVRRRYGRGVVCARKGHGKNRAGEEKGGLEHAV